MHANAGVRDLDLVEHLATVADAQDPSGERARDPDRAFGVETDAVGNRALELREEPPLGERAVVGDRERGEPAAVALADDQGAAVVGDDRPVREGDPVGRDAHGSVGLDEDDARLAGFSPPYMSKPKLPTYARPCASTTMSLHSPVASVDRSACSTSWPPSEPEHAAIEHRHDEHPAVGEPPEARRLLGHLYDRLGLAARVHPDDAPVVLVAEDETPVVPARTFGERETVEHDRGCRGFMRCGP